MLAFPAFAGAEPSSLPLVSRNSSGTMPSRQPMVTPTELPVTFANRVVFSNIYSNTSEQVGRAV
jgi:hypothetical protein